MAEFLFKPATPGKDCTENAGGWGLKSSLYDYIWKGDIDESTYPDEACPPRYHGNAKIDNLAVTATCGTASVTAFQGASITVSGTVTGATASAGVKNFNIPHPTKEGKRLIYGCLEGPEYGVYVRGRLTGSNVITLPEYWTGLVHEDSITVQMQPIGSRQHLIVEKFDHKEVHVIESDDKPIDCFYTINGTRKDVDRLEVEQDAD